MDAGLLPIGQTYYLDSAVDTLGHAAFVCRPPYNRQRTDGILAGVLIIPGSSVIAARGSIFLHADPFVPSVRRQMRCKDQSAVRR